MGLEVESFHINVGAGDGAIHLLTRDADPPPITDPYTPTPPPHDGRRVVVQAFLIDGGVAGCHFQIDELIGRIEKTYKCPCKYKPGENFLMFDGFIITHWDRDHYGGVAKWLYDELDEIDRTAQNQAMGERWSFPRAHYKDNWTAESYVYSPDEWIAKSKFTIKNNGLSLESPKKDPLKKKGDHLALVRTSYTDLLGRNIFRQQSEGALTAKKQAAIAKLATLLGPEGNPILPPDGRTETHDIPALYCVAAQRRVLGHIKMNTTATNKSSLVFIIVWKHADDSHHVSHYFGGDAHSKLELLISEWINPWFQGKKDIDEVPPADKVFQVTSMKLSHHGASSSNPREMFYRFRPKNILVSAGNVNEHPTWQVITWIYLWYTSVIVTKPFYPCQWPYWLIKDTNGVWADSNLNFRDLTGKKANVTGKKPGPPKKKKDPPPTGKPGKVPRIDPTTIIKQLAAKVSRGRNTRRNTNGNKTALRNALQAAFNPNGTVNLISFLEAMDGFMPEIAQVPRALVMCDVAVTGNNPATTMRMNKLLSVQVTCKSDPSTDGQVTLVGSGGKNTSLSKAMPFAVDSCSRSPVMEQSFPANRSKALLTARTWRAERKEDRDGEDEGDGGEDEDDDNDEGDGDGDDDDDDDMDDPPGAVDMYPYKGFDRPRTIDISTGNPDWDKIRAREPYGNKSAEEKEADDDWDNVDDFDAQSVTSLESVVNPSVVRFQQLPPELHVLASKVYITCTDETQPKHPLTLPEGSDPCWLDPENLLSGFLNTLHFQAIGLSEVPVPGQSTPIPVDADDEMFHWLARFIGWDPEKQPVPDGFALGMRPVSEWPLTDRKTTRLHFEMTVPFMSGPGLCFSTDQGANATFSRVDETDTKSGSEGWTRGVTPEALEELLLYRRTMVFGLEDLKDPLQTNLKDLATFMRVDIVKHPLLSYLTEAVPMTLDTSKDFHNAVWFRPSMNYQTVMRLQFRVDTTVFNRWLSSLSPTLEVRTLRVIGKKTASWIWAVPEDKMAFTSSIAFLCRMTISSRLELEGVFEFAEKDSVSLQLTLNQTSSSSLRVMSGSNGWLKDIMSWLGKHFGLTDTSDLDATMGNATNPDTGVMRDDSIIPRRIDIHLGLAANGEITGVRSVSIDIEACLTIGRSAVEAAEEMSTVFLFTIGWTKSRGFHLRGKLWSVIPATPFEAYDRALHEVEEYNYLKPMSPLDPTNQRRTIDLARLLFTNSGEMTKFPAGIPNEIYMCEISLEKGKVAFTGKIRCSKPDNTGQRTPPPVISLGNLDLNASYTWGTTNPNQDGFSMELTITLDLYLGEVIDKEKDLDKQYDAAAKMAGRVIYDKGNWFIEASVNDLSIMHLLQFWDADDRGPISDFLGGIHIDFVQLKYDFSKAKPKMEALAEDNQPSLLTIEGQFTFAQVASLTFTYTNPGGDDWALRADLGTSGKTQDTATIGLLLSGFIEDPLILNSLPDAIRHAAIKGADGEQALRMVVAKKKGISVFALLVSIEKVSVWFIQLRQGPKGAVKRILKAVVSKISVDVPAFQTTINSPWEDFSFLWVQDQTKPRKGVNALTGITQQEYDAMSEVMREQLHVKDEQLLFFKPVAEKEPGDGVLRITDGKEDKTDKTGKVVMAAGFHLVIVANKADGNPAVILDYLFGAKTTSAEGKTYDTSNTLVPYAASKAPDASGAEKGVKAPYKVKIGPLSVGNVGLWFKEGLIGVTLDASLILGPLGLSLLGFTIGVPFGGKYSLENPPPPSSIEWGLKGLILALDKPPLTVAGGFMRADSSDESIDVMYTGGLIVGFKPWSFEAMGAYATVYKDKKASGEWTTRIDTRSTSLFSLEGDVEEKRDTFTFSFIYVKMNGPLFSVGFADFAGLVGGIGVNSDITLPTVEQVTQFPFVAERDSSDESSPVERMQQLVQGSWFRPAEGLYWAAAGARVTAFQMLAANIVLILQFGNGNLLFGIFGVATCDVPSLESPVKFAHVELGIVCTFDVNSGIFKFEAQLSPRSFVLAPQCHLTGGIALFAWSKGDYTHKESENQISAGDWVLTMGGFHRAFRRPRQYPNPPRLGVSWSLSSCLSVKGEAYFAITPKVCMGGGRLRAALSVGMLYAWFDALVDFLMNFEPFFFQMTARVSVGVKYTLDLWLVTIRISVEIGAGLDLQGPAFGGVVHVDFWVLGSTLPLDRGRGHHRKPSP